MNLRNPVQILAIALFGAATLWINYEVKTRLQGAGGAGTTGEIGNIKVGMPAPGFSLPDLAGKTVNLADFRKQKVVLIDFWATWCGPCRMAMPGLQKLLDDFASRGIEILSVNQGETSAQAGDFMKEKGYGFHVLLDEQSAVGSLYGVRGIPTLVAVDKKGTVRWIRVGYGPEDADLRELLEKLVME